MKCILLTLVFASFSIGAMAQNVENKVAARATSCLDSLQGAIAPEQIKACIQTAITDVEAVASASEKSALRESAYRQEIAMKAMQIIWAKMESDESIAKD